MNVSGTTRVFATFGNPNIGNPAPAVYNAAFEAAGLDAVYVALEPRDIGAAMSAVVSLGLGGGTVTAPFKQEVVQHLDEVDEHASAIGAVNVVVHRDGRLIGHNTDWLGAVAALRDVIEPAGRRVALLGAGGAARALAYGLRSAGADTVVFNRTQASAVELCETFGCRYGGSLDALAPEFDIVVNATSVGMGERSEQSPIAATSLANAPVVFDIVVRPRVTMLAMQARELGCAVVPGIAMVAHQAVPALEWLTGVAPDLALLRERFG